MAALLDITDLHTEIKLRRGAVHAVDGVSFQVFPGETLGLVGESGCGKTMTALSVMGLLPAAGRITGGSITFDGEDLTTLGHRDMAAIRGDRIGMVFQDPLTSLNPSMTVGAQIAETVLLHRDVTNEQARRRALEVLDLVQIPAATKRIDEYPHQFSGGMRQRVVIAMALACEPKLLIADEPTTALDVTTQRQILALFDELRDQLSMAVMLITHDLGVIAGRADRVVVMYAGRIAEVADATTLFGQPRHRYTEALFRALPDGTRSRNGPLESIPGRPPDLVHPPVGCRFSARCRHATAECDAATPDLVSETPGHFFACLHPTTPGPDTDRPATTAARTPTPEEQPRPDEAGTPVLACQDLVKTFGVDGGRMFRRGRGQVSAVAGVSLTVHERETLGLVGESGCGKTTLGRLLVSLERPTSGSVLLDGTDLVSIKGRDLRRRRRDLQLVFQDSAAALDPRMRVGGILTEPLRIQHLGDPRSRRTTVAQLLDDVGLPGGSVERYPHEFSGGQRQRLSLARALALRPRVIVADEPVSALDVSVQAQILNLMSTLQAEHSLTYVLISHDLSVVRYLADRIGVMCLGKLVEIGPRDDVYEHPLHPYTRELIDAVPVPDPISERGKQPLSVRGELPSALNPPSGCRFRTRCPLAEPICAEQEPPLRPTPDGKHHVACHFPLGKVAEPTAATIQT